MRTCYYRVFFTLIENKLLNIPTSGSCDFTQETKEGVFPVTCYPDGLVVMTQKSPQFIYTENNIQLIAELLSLPTTVILDQPVQLVSTGVPKLMIPVLSREALFRIIPNLEGIKEYCERTGARGFYPFTADTIDPNNNYHARQFNPLAGINEDPITGIAAGALGGYIVE